uniref:Uncharacterized protein n=1 Tax=candidate division CPR3 bacterium TaxID=2268181 RepID=A0A7V3JAG0_UNCC3
MLKDVQSHVSVMNHEMGAVQAQLEVLMKFFWLLLGTSVSAIIGTIFNVVLHIRNNNQKNER